MYIYAYICTLSFLSKHTHTLTLTLTLNLTLMHSPTRRGAGGAASTPRAPRRVPPGLAAAVLLDTSTTKYPSRAAIFRYVGFRGATAASAASFGGLIDGCVE